MSEALFIIWLCVVLCCAYRIGYLLGKRDEMKRNFENEQKKIDRKYLPGGNTLIARTKYTYNTGEK